LRGAEDDLVIGTCTLFRIEREHRRAEIGYILRRDHWERGLANEALTALVNHAFGTLALHRLRSRHRSKKRSVDALRRAPRLQAGRDSA
jgi:RimJ/RimL family protein N-acetyltransferase